MINVIFYVFLSFFAQPNNNVAKLSSKIAITKIFMRSGTSPVYFTEFIKLKVQYTISVDANSKVINNREHCLLVALLKRN